MISVKSSSQRLQEQLQLIKQKMLELLDLSTINHFQNDPDSNIVILLPRHHWGVTDEKQKVSLVAPTDPPAFT